MKNDTPPPVGSGTSGRPRTLDEATRDAPSPAVSDAQAHDRPTSAASAPGRPRDGPTTAPGQPRDGRLPDLERLGRYTILGRLGTGGMGTVFDAFDHNLDRRVALKVLRKSSAAWTRRLIREAQALAKLSHPNVVQVYEVGAVDGRAFVAMERLEGQTVADWSRQYPPPDWRACVGVFVQLGRGLAAAHARGLVHRDFKPGNAIIDDNGRARVLDFGLARHADAAAEDSQPPEPVEDTVGGEHSALSVRMTREGAILGTPLYMSPEQSVGGEVDAASDQFSFCVALWESQTRDLNPATSLVFSPQQSGIMGLFRSAECPLLLLSQRFPATVAETSWRRFATVFLVLKHPHRTQTGQDTRVLNVEAARSPRATRGAFLPDRLALAGIRVQLTGYIVGWLRS